MQKKISKRDNLHFLNVFDVPNVLFNTRQIETVTSFKHLGFLMTASNDPSLLIQDYRYLSKRQKLLKKDDSEEIHRAMILS